MDAQALVVPLATFLGAEKFAAPLPSSVLAAIEALTSHVSAPEYVRTPQFSRRSRRGGRDSRDIEWSGSGSGPLRDFKPTRIEKRAGVAGTIDRLRKHLNKMSDKTYEVLRDRSFAEIDGHEGGGESQEIAVAIFDVLSSNAFYGRLYASFYRELLTRYPAMRGVLERQLSGAPVTLVAVEYCDPKVDYDQFCANNRKNAILRGTAAFYVHLASLGVVSEESVVALLRTIQQALSSAPPTPESGPLCDELSERIFSMLSCPASSCLCQATGWTAVVSNLTSYAEESPCPARGVTAKSVFRHMDIVDIVKARGESDRSASGR